MIALLGETMKFLEGLSVCHTELYVIPDGNNFVQVCRCITEAYFVSLIVITLKGNDELQGQKITCVRPCV